MTEKTPTFRIALTSNLFRMRTYRNQGPQSKSSPATAVYLAIIFAPVGRIDILLLLFAAKRIGGLGVYNPEFLDPEGGSQKATLVVLLLVAVTSSLKKFLRLS